MLDWLQRYCTNDEGWGHDTPHMFEWGAWVAEIWALATDRKTLVAIRNSRRWSVGSGFNRLGIGRLGAAVRAESPDWAIECDLADLLRFAGYVQRDACETCFWGSVESLCRRTLDRPQYQQIGSCVDCYQSNGWITPAIPVDDRKARVAGVTVCMSRLAWSIPPEVIEPDSRVLLWRYDWGVSGLPHPLVIDDADRNWRVMVAPCDITDAKVVPPTFHPDPLFARLWEAARDDPAAMVALADWLEEREDAFAEVLR